MRKLGQMQTWHVFRFLWFLEPASELIWVHLVSVVQPHVSGILCVFCRTMLFNRVAEFSLTKLENTCRFFIFFYFAIWFTTSYTLLKRYLHRMVKERSQTVHFNYQLLISMLRCSLGSDFNAAVYTDHQCEIYDTGWYIDFDRLFIHRLKTQVNVVLSEMRHIRNFLNAVDNNM